MSYFKTAVALFLMTLSSCSLIPKKKDPSMKIATGVLIPTVVAMETSQFPSSPQSLSFTAVSQSDFVNGLLGADIVSGPVPSGFGAADESGKALAEGVFTTLPGFVFSVKPSADVKITLSSRGRLQSVKKTPNVANRVAVSLAEFPEVYPPLFRERYDLTISSLPGNAQPFTFNYGFTVVSNSQISQFVSVLPGEGSQRMLMATNVNSLVLAKLSTSGKCDSCIIQVSSVTARQSIKRFAELPALPKSGSDRISTPERFSGLLTKTLDETMVSSYVGNNTGLVTVKVNIDGLKTTVPPWCAESEGAQSTCLINNSPTYFKNVNAVRQDTSIRLLGGVSGVLSYYITGSAVIVIKRDGVIMETKTVDFISDQVSVLTSATLPSWALDDIRTAAFSGRPVFFMDQ